MLGILAITVFSSVIFYTVRIQAANGLDATVFRNGIEPGVGHVRGHGLC